MVDISHETPEQTGRRLRRVLASAQLSWSEGAFAFGEAPISRPPALGPDVLAVVRDEDTWSWLAPAGPDASETFAVWSFHFTPGEDNSGFVGWLATELKRRLGTGVIVICGHNRSRGGVFDHWGCPYQLRTAAADVLAELRAAQ